MMIGAEMTEKSLVWRGRLDMGFGGWFPHITLWDVTCFPKVWRCGWYERGHDTWIMVQLQNMGAEDLTECGLTDNSPDFV